MKKRKWIRNLLHLTGMKGREAQVLVEFQWDLKVYITAKLNAILEAIPSVLLQETIQSSVEIQEILILDFLPPISNRCPRIQTQVHLIAKINFSSILK